MSFRCLLSDHSFLNMALDFAIKQLTLLLTSINGD